MVGESGPLRTVVLVSPQFPPSPLAAAHRARHLAKHLPACGWRPVVLRVDERHYVERLDPALNALVPGTVEQVRVKALPAWLTRAAGVGDLGLRAYPYLARALDQLMQTHRPEVIFFTGFPFYPFLMAARVKRRHRVAVVLDFQDPWVSAYGATRQRASKEGLAHRLALALEPKALRAADFVTAVSEIQNGEMAARYPWLDSTRMAAIPIGGDPDDFAAMRATPMQDARFEPGTVNLCYVGAYWPRAEPVIRCVLRAAAKLRQNDPVLATRLRLNFVGTCSTAAGRASEQVMPLAHAEGVEDMVREAPQRLPFLEALRMVASADGLLLIGSDEPHYTASKIYPALMSGRPFLSLFHRSSSAHAILARAGGGRALAFDHAAALPALEAEVAEGLRTLALAPQDFGHVDPAAFRSYTARAVSGRFAEIFDAVTERVRAPSSGVRPNSANQPLVLLRNRAQ
jgi:hypothetical protein